MWWTNSATVFEPATSQSSSSACGCASNHVCHFAVVASLSASNSLKVIAASLMKSASSLPGCGHQLLSGPQGPVADVTAIVHSFEVDLGKCVVGKPKGLIEICRRCGDSNHTTAGSQIVPIDQGCA